MHVIVDAPAGSLKEAQLLEFLVERLVRYKIPRSVECVKEPLREDAAMMRLRHVAKTYAHKGW